MTTYFLQDGLGSTTGLTDGDGAMTDAYTYDVFGATKSHTGASANAWLFTGELNDSSVSRSPYYLRARYYDPAIGRFFSQDPWFANRMNPQSWNSYVYAYNNPALLIDPLGLCASEGTPTPVAPVPCRGRLVPAPVPVPTPCPGGGCPGGGGRFVCIQPGPGWSDIVHGIVWMIRHPKCSVSIGLAAGTCGVTVGKVAVAIAAAAPTGGASIVVGVIAVAPEVVAPGTGCLASLSSAYRSCIADPS